MKELTKDEAAACLLCFLLGPVGSKHHSCGSNTYPKGGNKLVAATGHPQGKELLQSSLSVDISLTANE